MKLGLLVFSGSPVSPIINYDTNIDCVSGRKGDKEQNYQLENTCLTFLCSWYFWSEKLKIEYFIEKHEYEWLFLS